MFGRTARRTDGGTPTLPFISFDRKFLFAWTASLAIVGAVALLGYRSSNELQTSSRRLEEVFRIREALADVSMSLLAMESSQRGFMLSRNPEHLRNYDEAGRHLRQSRATLQAVGEGARLMELWPLVDAKVAHMDEVLRLVTSRQEDAARLTLTGEGRRWMGRIRDVVLQSTDRLDQDLQVRRHEAGRSLRNDVAVSAILTGTLATLLVFIHALMVRERHSRDALTSLQAEARVELERHVTSRTAEFSEKAEQLRVSENRFRAVFDAVPEAILSADNEQAITVANPAAARIFGFEPGELIGRPLSDLIPFRYRTQHGRAVQGFSAPQGETRRMGRNAEVSGLRKDGTEFPAEATISMVRFAEASIYTVVLRDITERLRAEAVIRDSEKWLRTVLEALPDAVVVVSQGLVSYVNSRAEVLFGSRAGDILGREALSLFRPDFHSLIEHRLEQLLSGASLLPSTTLVVQALDGRAIETESSAALVRETDGWSVIVSLRDLTHIRKIEGELSESRDRLRLLVNAQVGTQETERRRIAMELHDDLQQSMAAIKMDIAAALKALGTGAEDAAKLLRSAGELTDAALQSTRRIVNDLRPQMLDDLGLEAALHYLATAHGRRTGAESRFVATGQLDEAQLPSNAAISLFRIAQEALNNAAKHAYAAHAWVRLESSPGQVRLSVEDDGVGIHDDDRAKLNAFGLHGMSERVAALGGCLNIVRRREGGTAVAVQIPLLATSA